MKQNKQSEEKKKKENLINKIFSSTKTTVVFILGVLLVTILLYGVITDKKELDERQKAIQEAREKEAERVASQQDLIDFNGSDRRLMEAQPDLLETYGELPKGYIWDFDGTLLSLGDKDLSAEETVYAYLNGIRSLDFSMAQKYSRNSSVVNTYENYFSNGENKDYYDSFLRNMYKEVLLSIQVIGVKDISVFANNKQVFTLELIVLDLQNKDFWKKDEKEIFNNLYIYSLTESDDAKSDIYLYDYVLDYYKSSEAFVRKVNVNIVVEKYQDLDTGWLVSSDSDLDDICRYKDGNLIVSYIQEQFRNRGKEEILESQNSSEETTTSIETPDISVLE